MSEDAACIGPAPLLGSRLDLLLQLLELAHATAAAVHVVQAPLQLLQALSAMPDQARSLPGHQPCI